jgi:uncharacterized protein
MTNRGIWLETYSGRKIFPLAARVSEIKIEDIAHALSNICRFAGHTNLFFSVAQHSVLVAELSNNKMEGLLHDATEAYLVDIPRPVKLALPQYKEYEANLCKVIFRAFKLQYPIPEDVLLADEIMLEAEHKRLLKSEIEWEELPDEYRKIKDFEKLAESVIIDPFLPKDAEKLFLEAFERYSKEGKA